MRGSKATLERVLSEKLSKAIKAEFGLKSCEYVLSNNCCGNRTHHFFGISRRSARPRVYSLDQGAVDSAAELTGRDLNSAMGVYAVEENLHSLEMETASYNSREPKMKAKNNNIAYPRYADDATTKVAYAILAFKGYIKRRVIDRTPLKRSRTSPSKNGGSAKKAAQSTRAKRSGSSRHRVDSRRTSRSSGRSTKKRS